MKISWFDGHHHKSEYIISNIKCYVSKSEQMQLWCIFDDISRNVLLLMLIWMVERTPVIVHIDPFNSITTGNKQQQHCGQKARGFFIDLCCSSLWIVAWSNNFKLFAILKRTRHENRKFIHTIFEWNKLWIGLCDCTQQNANFGMRTTNRKHLLD